MNGGLDIRNVSKKFDGVNALWDFTCSVGEREILGLIGPNGAGKTTLFNVITRFLKPDAGQVTFRGIDLSDRTPEQMVNLGIARTFQELRLIRHLSAIENVLLAIKNQPGERLSNVFLRPRVCMLVESENRERAASVLEDTGLAESLNKPAGQLSYGQQKLLTLACCLAPDADLILLDEPVAGIAMQMKEAILSIIAAQAERGKSVLLIEHDLEAVMQVCHRVVFMDSGKKVSEGAPQDVRDDPNVIEAYIH